MPKEELSDIKIIKVNFPLISDTFFPLCITLHITVSGGGGGGGSLRLDTDTVDPRFSPSRSADSLHFKRLSAQFKSSPSHERRTHSLQSLLTGS